MHIITPLARKTMSVKLYPNASFDPNDEYNKKHGITLYRQVDQKSEV